MTQQEYIIACNEIQLRRIIEWMWTLQQGTQNGIDPLLYTQAMELLMQMREQLSIALRIEE